MTYPPQGPGPYGQQPPDPFQQGPYQQQPPWAVGPQGGFPMGPPPKQPKTGLITSLIIVAILVVGGGGVGLYFLLNKEDRNDGTGDGGSGEGGTARGAAQTYVRELENALNTKLQDVDLAPLEPVTCGKDFSEMSDELAEAKDYGESNRPAPTPEKIQIRMEDFKESADGATFTMTEREAGDDDTDSRNMTVAKEGGGWKVCGIYENNGGGSPPTAEEGGPSQAPSGEAPPNPFPSR
jgi:hypothetical protein